MGSYCSKNGRDVVADHNLSGKVAIVTGPTSGIGYEISLELASIGCHIVLAGRGQSRLEKLITTLTQQLAKTHPTIKPQFTAIELDLTSFVSIHTFVTQFRALKLPCHYLFNNAGVMMTDYSKTVDGFEMQIGTNCIGHQYLTNLLMPTLLTSAPARIINTSSMGHLLSKYDVTKGEEECKRVLYATEQEYSRVTAYGNSKIGNIFHAREITRRYGSQGVIALACHPGMVATELGRHTWYNVLIYKGFPWAWKTSNQGAATELWGALDDTWPKRINEMNFSFFALDCYIANRHASTLSRNGEFGKIWYDYNDREIARVATQLGLPTSFPSTSTSTSTSDSRIQQRRPINA